MARKVEVQLFDDVDGNPADETLAFSLDGMNYEIDVSSKRADELRAGLWPFISKARKVGRGVVGSSQRHTMPARNDRAQNRAIREWAKRKKIELSDRGRIPRDIVIRYETEAGR